MSKKIKFLNCKIDLSKKVFEPRIETEFWVGNAIEEIKLTTNNQQLTTKILDLFAGTGCIGIAVLKNIENAKVDFADISKEAIEQIKINLKLNQIPKDKYKIYKSNLFEKLKGEKLAPYRNKVSGAGYDIIFANPPYVAENRISEVDEEVLKKDPEKSLFAGKDGMFWIEKFLKEIKNYLKKAPKYNKLTMGQGGIFYLEFDPLQKEKIKKILEKDYNPPTTLPSKARAPSFKFTFRKDQFQKFRWLKVMY